MAKKKKIRVDLRKNRRRRARANDLTRAFEDQAPEASESIASERVRPRGEMSRRRTIVADAADVSAASGGEVDVADASTLRAVDESALLGRVVKVHGLINIVRTEDGRTFPCHVRRVLKSMAIDGRNVVAVGDRVWFRPPDDERGEEGFIERVESREGVITRGYRGRRHVLAANVDAVMIVSAFAEPELKPNLIDRYLVAAELGGVRPVIVLNKADLVDVSLFQWVIGLYSQLGYETIATSATDGAGLDRLRALFNEGVTAISGQSGVGKSSLLNAIQPGLDLKVGEVSEWTFKGRHTTTTAELIHLDLGGFVIDTPGLRQFELWDVAPGELEAYFVEFRPYIPLCRFPDCSHTHENHCAVKEAVYWGQIHAGRYDSYLKLLHQTPIEGY